MNEEKHPIDHVMEMPGMRWVAFLATIQVQVVTLAIMFLSQHIQNFWGMLLFLVVLIVLQSFAYLAVYWSFGRVYEVFLRSPHFRNIVEAKARQALLRYRGNE